MFCYFGLRFTVYLFSVLWEFLSSVWSRLPPCRHHFRYHFTSWLCRGHGSVFLLHWGHSPKDIIACLGLIVRVTRSLHHKVPHQHTFQPAYLSSSLRTSLCLPALWRTLLRWECCSSFLLHWGSCSAENITLSPWSTPPLFYKTLYMYITLRLSIHLSSHLLVLLLLLISFFRLPK